MPELPNRIWYGIGPGPDKWPSQEVCERKEQAARLKDSGWTVGEYVRAETPALPVEYAELVERLRGLKVWDDHPSNASFGEKAADAITTLSARIEALEAELRATAEARLAPDGVAVKALAWRDTSDKLRRFSADSILGTYAVIEEASGSWFVGGAAGARPPRDAENAEQWCYDWAQADYDKRIRSALYAHPASDTALREALEDWRWIGPALAGALKTRSTRAIAVETGLGHATIARIANGHEPNVETYLTLTKWLAALNPTSEKNDGPA